ncbi:MAG TPA: MFS transporter, partial [Longimicrobium sp.]|nr:MFS transporter [Longimicrobium sp.]
GALARDVRALPRTAWIVYAGTFLNRFGSFVLPFLVLVLVRRGFSPAEAGIAVSAYGVGGVAAGVMGGHLADRIGRRRTIVLSMFSGAAVMLLLWRAEGIAATVALAGLAGATAEMYRPAAAALLADVTPVGRRVATFALYRMAINGGFAMGPAVAGFLATRSLALVFIGDAVTCVLYGLLVLFAVPPDPPRPAPVRAAPETAAPPHALRTIAADRAFVTVLAAAVAIAFVYQQATVSLGLEVDARGLSPAHYGVLASLNGLFCLLLELPVASVTARGKVWAAMAAGALLTGLGFGATALAPGFAALAVTVFVWSMGEMVWAPVAAAYVADLAPAGLQGRYQAAFGLTNTVGLVLASTLGLSVFAWSRGALWSLCALTGAAAGLLCVTLRAAPRPAPVSVPLT